ncbi:Thiazole synthase [Candidatus Kinetoplastibacterium sorsogonicusi]|uniref:Thiazole synthase n=1 Tax=Candidatus Kinetoplastidibacterium kentomonadis TaxID=1576550 RepID=A0A3S7J974_9PROT|nr:thiazole synthase [Candidatus Kinetoplastibacterium sorsogonicusi]AWD32208.1 Thiazole synthase [Candidatus Kinetoplastibacterium sorsogonicusi]
MNKQDNLLIANKKYSSRLIVGTGKYKNFEQTKLAVQESGAEIITVAIRRTNIGQNKNEQNLLDFLPKSNYTLLPNTAGCFTSNDAIRTLRLARELLDGDNLVKLEVLADQDTLFPNMPETLKATSILVKEGFNVMVYCTDDPIQCHILEDLGAVAVMPLASLIGSGMGILNPWNIKLIIDRIKIPVLIDAGVGTASDATIAMELGCDGVLMNSAIAYANNPVLMAKAMKQAVQSGRNAYLAGRMAKKNYSGIASSPIDGLINSSYSL